MLVTPFTSSFFFFNDTATTEIYTLSLHDALPIYWIWPLLAAAAWRSAANGMRRTEPSLISVCSVQDRKSTRLNSSHSQISYAVFCLKKKKNKRRNSREAATRSSAVAGLAKRHLAH